MGARQAEVTRLALEWYRVNKRYGFSKYYAAKMHGISPSTLYRALQRRKEKR